MAERRIVNAGRADIEHRRTTDGAHGLGDVSEIVYADDLSTAIADTLGEEWATKVYASTEANSASAAAVAAAADSGDADDGDVWTADGAGGAAWEAPTGGGGTGDHGALTGLGDDDHTQYHTAARHDARNATTHTSGSAKAAAALTATGTGGSAWQRPYEHASSGVRYEHWQTPGQALAPLPTDVNRDVFTSGSHTGYAQKPVKWFVFDPPTSGNGLLPGDVVFNVSGEAWD